MKTAKAHTHGVAELDLVRDGNNISVSLYSPLQNILGFEHAPKTDQEKAVAQKAVEVLKSGSLFVFDQNAGCKQIDFNYTSDALSGGNSGTKSRHEHHEDLTVSWEFVCSKADEARQVQVRLFRQFAQFTQIDVQAVTGSGQTGARLTPQNNILKLK